jgi:hypothetical protein
MADIKADRAIVGAQGVKVELLPFGQPIRVSDFENDKAKRIGAIAIPCMLQMAVLVRSFAQSAAMLLPSLADTYSAPDVDFVVRNTSDLVDAGGIRWYNWHADLLIRSAASGVLSHVRGLFACIHYTINSDLPQQNALKQKELAAAQAMAQGITIGRSQSGHDETP